MSPSNDPKSRLHTIFYPRSIAVVGANNVAGTVPCDIFVNILRGSFAGPVYPVSPRDAEVAGVRAYKYISDIPNDIDLAVLVFPASVCHLALEQCGKKGVRAAIVISAGFKEVGPKGKEKEEQLRAVAASYNISFIGPNCLGVINTDPTVRLNASFARRMPCEGPIAFLSQSGALCTAVLDFAYARRIGFSKFISFGNKADISEIDLLRYLKHDPKTRVILLYLEEISDGTGLLQVVEEIRVEEGKPVLILKSGRTVEGAKAAASHTGSLAGSDAVCDAAFKQRGVIRCSTIEDMFNKAIAFAYQPLPSGPRIALVTNAGGPGVLATDAAVFSGLTVDGFSPTTIATFKKKLPVTANIKNPVDLIGDAHSDRYAVALSTLLADPLVDGIGVILTPQSMTDIEEIAQAIVLSARQATKPIYASFMGEYDVVKGIEILRANQIPHYSLPEAMCSAFAAAWNFKRLKSEDNGAELPTYNGIDKERAAAVLREAQTAGKRQLDFSQTAEVLAAYGIPTPMQKIAPSLEDARRIAQEIGFPVVFKISSDDIIHKSDVGGVITGITTPQQACEAWDTIMASVRTKQPTARINGMLVSAMITSGQEVIVGMSRDPVFGPVIMFGIGGVLVEILRDVCFMTLPLRRRDIATLVESVRMAPVLKGIRGQPSLDVLYLHECIGRFSLLAQDFSIIREMEINPLMVKFEGHGCCAVDARILI